MIVCIILLVYLVARIAISLYILCKNKERFDDPSFTDKYGAFMTDLRPTGYAWEPIFMILKLSFVAIPLLMRDQGN